MDEKSEGVITKKQISAYSQKYNSKKYAKAATNAVSRSGINAAAYNNEVPAKTNYRFSIELETMKVTNQKKSGRCWIFAGLNILREDINKKLNIEFFELSQNYMAFWDKFEKVNFFLECIIETIDEETESRLVTWLLQNPLSDGGQWDMFVSLANKYGVIPKDAMPETFNSSGTNEMNSLLMAKMREFSIALRKAYSKSMNLEKIRVLKEEMLSDVYTFLCIFFGEPPSIFDFEYTNKDKKFFRDKGLTPLEFMKEYVSIDLQDYISVINAPTKDKPFNRAFTVKFLGNVVGGDDILYLNTDIKTLKTLAKSQLKDHGPVWFGCDVRAMSDLDAGIMDADMYRYDLALDMSFSLSKEERLDFRESFLTHAMVFTGVNLDEDIPDRWKVENSWGDEKGEKGYFVMSDSWFDEFLYQIVVHKKYLTEELKEALEKKVIELAPWDPMGSLA